MSSTAAGSPLNIISAKMHGNLLHIVIRNLHVATAIRFTTLYSALLCSSLPFSTTLLYYSFLLYAAFALFYSNFYSTLLYSALIISTLLQATLLYSTLLCSTLLYSTQLYFSLLLLLLLLLLLPYSTLLWSTLLFSALPLLYRFSTSGTCKLDPTGHKDLGLVRM